MSSGTSDDADRLLSSPSSLGPMPCTPGHAKPTIVTPLTPISPLPPTAPVAQKSAAPPQSLPLVNNAANSASGGTSDSVVTSEEALHSVGPIHLADVIPSQHDKQVRRGHGTANTSHPAPNLPHPPTTTENDGLTTHDAIVIDANDSASTMLAPKMTMAAAATTTLPAPEKPKLLPPHATAAADPQDMTAQVETLTAQLNRLQRRCDQMAGLLQLKDWITSLWMKRTQKWEAQVIELEHDRNHLRDELEHREARKAFWRRTATERLTTCHEWMDACQKQSEEIVSLKHQVDADRGRIETLESLLDEVGSVASTASTELALSIDDLDDSVFEDSRPETESALTLLHPALPARTSYMSTVSGISSTSGSSGAESYDGEFDDADDEGHAEEMSDPATFTAAVNDPGPELEPEPAQTKEEIEKLQQELRKGQAEFEQHLLNYAADREALDQEWNELSEAQELFRDEYENWQQEVHQAEEVAARRSQTLDRRANILLDQEMELDGLKRRYQDKLRNYERISIDLKQREDQFFASMDYMSILQEDAEDARIHNAATEEVLREEWNDVEDAWMAVWRRQTRLIRAEGQRCSCPCSCGTRNIDKRLLAWNDDEIPALLLGEEGREAERTARIEHKVEEEVKRRRHEGRRLRCVQNCDCPDCEHAPKEEESPIMGPPDRDGLHGLALELPVASSPPSEALPHAAAETHPEGEEEVEPFVEDDDASRSEDLQEDPNDSDGESCYLESSSSPKPLPPLPDSPSARADLYLLEDDMFIHIEKGLTSRRM